MNRKNKVTELGSPTQTHDGFGLTETLPLSRVRQITGSRLHAAWTSIPHVTQFEDADITSLEAWRRNSGDKPHQSLLTLAAHAILLTLKAHPRFCASLASDGKSLTLKHYLHLGVAVETPAGLIVAVIKNADLLTLNELGSSITDIADRGRSGKIRPEELEGSCFTLSSLGHIGGATFTPIINPPNVGILGLSRARWRPECVDGTVIPRYMLPLSLSYDHRAIDGAEAARFIMSLSRCLASPPR